MELFADRDPEAAQKIFDPVLERMIEAVHHYEGTVNRVMGDGIMALFGAPIAHEDHAVRACYAALRMQETVKQYAEDVQRSQGVAVTIRVGLNSGEIVVCGIGNDLHLEYTVVGQTANLAARLEQMAKPGSVLTAADTVQLAEGYIAMKPLGPVSVKGLPHPVQVYEVTGVGEARTRLQVSAGRGLTRFVGRDVELEQLHRVQQLAGQGHGQVVAIVGEAGVGKSRLVHEFVHSRHTADWLILESSSVSYGRATPYLPVIGLLKNYFKISAQDSTQLIREKVTERILALDQSLQDAIPPVLDLLDALDENDPFRSLDLVRHRQYTYQAVVRLLLSESRVQPFVVVFEDLHWNDSLSFGLLSELVVAMQDARLLLVVSYRPAEYRDEWRNRPNYRQVRLDPLASEGLAQFLEALLGSDPTLATLKSFLVGRASGNPFFAEEIVRGLVATGMLEGARGSYRLARPFSGVEIPPTVQAVLAARVDALPPADKHLLQEAAVIGHDVPFALLHAICGLTEDELRGLLDNLQAAEFLYSSRLFPELQYTFKHALTHDVTYSGVLHERRREIHARVVNATETLYADRLGEQVERLAYHTVQGDLKEKAVHYLRQAGAKAAGRSAVAAARTWFEQALDVLKSLPESQATMEQAFEIRLELRPVLRQLGEVRQMLEHLREAEALAERLKDDRRRGQVCGFMTTVLSTLERAGRGPPDRYPRPGDRPAHRGLEASHRHDELSRAGVLLPRRVRARGRNRHREPRDAAHRMGPRIFRSGRAGIGLRSRLADHEPRRARQIRRGGQVRGGSDPTRRGNPARAHHRLGPFDREHASPLQGRLGEGALTGRTLDKHTSDFGCRRPHSLGGRRLRLGAGADRRGQRGIEPGAGGRATSRASSGAGNRRSSRLGLPRGESRLSAARPARRGAAPGPIARLNPLSASPALRPTRCTCSATSRPIPTGSMPKAAQPTTGRRWHSPSCTACARSSPTVISAWASSTAASASRSTPGRI